MYKGITIWRGIAQSIKTLLKSRLGGYKDPDIFINVIPLYIITKLENAQSIFQSMYSNYIGRGHIGIDRLLYRKEE